MRPFFGQELRERLPANQFHRDEVNAVRLFDRVDRDDVGVIEGGDSFGFTLEACPAFFVLSKRRRTDLEGDLSV